VNKGRFLNQKLGKRASRKMALLKSSLAAGRPPGWSKTQPQDSGFRIRDSGSPSSKGMRN